MHRRIMLVVGLVAALTGGLSIGEAGNKDHTKKEKIGDQDKDWIFLSKDLKAFREPTGDWFLASKVDVDAANHRRLAGTPGEGILVNGRNGRTQNLVTKEEWGDVELQLEFFIPERSNSGVKLMGVYEIQIYDSWKKTKLTGSDCGGIYPRGEMKPRYHHLDDGIAPRVNACKKPGQWQTLQIVFHAPRLDEKGNKTANARFDRVVLNGKVVHENQELEHPTGNAWKDKEHARGPLLLQADHGPVAYRNVRLRPLEGK
jgi:hypothetical protein